MNHKQILDKLSSRFLVKALDEEVARVVFYLMTGLKRNTITDSFDFSYNKILQRWQCLLKHNKDNQCYIEKFNIALAVLFHKYGISGESLTLLAIASIKSLNKESALGDAFYHKEKEIIQFLQAAPKASSRYPNRVITTTYYRPGDIVAFESDNRFVAAYIHADTGINEAPIIEFYDAVFDKLPTLDEIIGLSAYGKRIEKYAVYGMTYLPDLAQQITLIASGVEEKPDNTMQEEALGLYTTSDLYLIQSNIEQILRYYN